MNTNPLLKLAIKIAPLVLFIFLLPFLHKLYRTGKFVPNKKGKVVFFLYEVGCFAFALMLLYILIHMITHLPVSA